MGNISKSAQAQSTLPPKEAKKQKGKLNTKSMGSRFSILETEDGDTEDNGKSQRNGLGVVTFRSANSENTNIETTMHARMSTSENGPTSYLGASMTN